MTWRVVKTYGHEEGLSCCFRQWQAATHCRVLHGYALAFTFTFTADALDERGWVIDFGGLDPLRAWLHALFDHTLVVAADDPALAAWRSLADAGLADLRILPGVGCEAFARHAFEWAAAFVAAETGGRVRLEQVEVCERPGNAATYKP